METQEKNYDTADMYVPRKMTPKENAILTIKVLAALGIIGALIWGINIWTTQ